MDLVASDDFGAKDFDGEPGREIHNHLFLGANTGLAAVLGDDEAARGPRRLPQRTRRSASTSSASARAARSTATLTRPAPPGDPGAASPGRPTSSRSSSGPSASATSSRQGTVDSNEIWVELTAKAGGRVIGQSGGIDDEGYVDPYSHFINVYMLDRFGKRIDRRNAAGHLRPALQQADPPGGRPGRPLPARRAAAGHRRADRAGGEGQLPQVRPDLPRLRLRRGQGPRPDEDGEPNPLPVVVMATDAVTLAGRRRPDAREPAVADRPRVAALERLRHRPAARRRRQGRPEGRTEAGRAGLPRWPSSTARPTAGSTSPASTSGKAASPTPCRAPQGRRPPGAGGPLDDQLADRRRSTAAAATSTRRSGNFEEVLEHQGPQPEVRLQPGLRGHQRTRPRPRPPGPDRAARQPRAARLHGEGDRRLPADAGDRLRERARPTSGSARPTPSSSAIAATARALGGPPADARGAARDGRAIADRGDPRRAERAERSPGAGRGRSRRSSTGRGRSSPRGSAR